MASAMPSDGQIISCEVNPEHAEAARRNIAMSGYADRIIVKLGPALETVSHLAGAFDLIFIDADKTEYVDYFEAVLPKLNSTGLIVADNTLWNGDVLYETDDVTTAAL